MHSTRIVTGSLGRSLRSRVSRISLLNTHVSRASSTYFPAYSGRFQSYRSFTTNPPPLPVDFDSGEIANPVSSAQWEQLSHVYTKLDDFVVLRIEGHDASKVLQSLTTQNIAEYIETQQTRSDEQKSDDESMINILKREPNPSTPVSFSNYATGAAFLSSKGRLLVDCVLDLNAIPARQQLADNTPQGTVAATKRSPQLAANAYTDASFSLFLPRAVVPLLLAHIKDNSLRVKATIAVDETVDLWTVICRDDVAAQIVAQTLSLSGAAPGAGARVTVDPRPLSDAQGVLFVQAPRGSELVLPAPFTRVTPAVATVFRAVQGLPTAGLDLEPEKNLPLEAGLDLVGAVHFKKGCYLGQELTARTHFQGLVRKRVVPLALVPGVGNAPVPLHKMRLSSLLAPDADPESLFHYRFFDPEARNHAQPQLPPEDSPLYNIIKTALAEQGRDKGSFPQVGDSLMMGDAEIGKILSVPECGNVVFAMLRIEQITNPTGPIRVVRTEGEVKKEIVNENGIFWEGQPICPDYLVAAVTPKETDASA